MPPTKGGRSTGRRENILPADGGICGRLRASAIGVSKGTPEGNETELLAGTVLRAVNLVQAKGSTVRLVVPRAPEVTFEVGMELPEARILEVEEYLLDCGYIEPVDIGLTGGTYTITPAGLEWLDMGASEPLEAFRVEVTGPSEWAEPCPATKDTREDIVKRPQERIPRRLQRELNKARKQLEEGSKERGWWRRAFGG